MIENGSDVHQGGLAADAELLVAHGANANAEWNGDSPIVFASCENVT